MKKIAILLSLVGAMASQSVFAQEQACSTSALMAANQNMYDQFEAYTATQMEQGRSVEAIGDDMEQITNAANAEETLGRHQAELEMMEPGNATDHQPSQELCDDMYAMLDRMQDELDGFE